MTHFTHNAQLYLWAPVDAPETLYGVPVDPASLIPDGLTLTLRNMDGEAYVMRGEPHHGRITFTFITGRVIGAWVPTSTVYPVTYRVILSPDDVPVEPQSPPPVPAGLSAIDRIRAKIRPLIITRGEGK